MANVPNVNLDFTQIMVPVNSVLDYVLNAQVQHHVLLAEQVKLSWTLKKDVSVKLAIIKTTHKD
jgi:hypothetical protein